VVVVVEVVVVVVVGVVIVIAGAPVEFPVDFGAMFMNNAVARDTNPWVCAASQSYLILSPRESFVITSKSSTPSSR